tara:strand:- start:184 stop:378 length:195 start_codon:yes stop_codon:yes gene_type:complete
MKPAFLLMCYLSGAPAGTLHFQSVKTADYFKNFLDNQVIKIGEEEKKYDCFVKLVKVNKQMRLY